MHKSNVSFAKIVATPTDTAWSQVYNAGSLFAVLSLAAETSSDQPLNVLGKQIINNLEAEFFTLETKDLPSIKKAVSASVVDLPEGVMLSISLAYVKENVLYLLLHGPGKILLKRSDTIGPLLVNKGSEKSIHCASGYLANDDILLLQTEQFSQLVSEKELQAAFELSLPNDIAETLTPNVHKAEDGGASAIIVTFKGVPTPEQTNHPGGTTPLEKDQENDEADEQQVLSPYDAPTKTYQATPFSERFQTMVKQFNLSPLLRRKKTIVFLSLAVILTVLLAGGVFMTMNNQQNEKRKAAFETVFAAAEKEYEEGTGLLNLNPVYAREDLTAAKKTIEDALSQFPKGTEEEKKLQELLGKINTALGETSQVKLVAVTTAKKEDSPLLSALLDNDGLYSATDDDTIFVLYNDNIVTVSDGNEKEIIKNDEDWGTTGGFGAYNGNLYILDKKEGVLKFVAGAGGYGKSAYFSGTKPDVSKAVSLAIDGSIWIVQTDGTVTKYTKGKQDSFTIKGLDQPFKNPKAIFTTADTNGLYILDIGNNRIVQLNKDGSFKSQFVSPTFATARAIDVNETSKKLYILSSGNISQISLP